MPREVERLEQEVLRLRRELTRERAKRRLRIDEDSRGIWFVEFVCEGGTWRLRPGDRGRSFPELDFDDSSLQGSLQRLVGEPGGRFSVDVREKISGMQRHLDVVAEADGEEVLLYGKIGLPVVRSGLRHPEIEQFPEPVVIVSPEGRLRYMNEPAAELLGIGERAVPTSSLAEFIEESPDLVRRWLGAVVSRARGTSRVQAIRRPDGREVEIGLAATPVVFNDEQGVLITARERDAADHAPEKLLEVAEQLLDREEIFSQVALAVTDAENGTFLDVTRPFAELIGEDRDAIVGRTSLEIGIWEDETQRSAFVEQVRESSGPFRREYLLVRNGEPARPVLISATELALADRLALLVSVSDRSQEAAARRAEEESRLLLSKIYHDSPVPIVIMDASTRRFIDVNEAFATLSGWELDQLIGATPSERELWNVEEIVPAPSAVDEELTVHTRTGHRCQVIAKMQQIQLGDRKAILGVLTDITQRYQADRVQKRFKFITDNANDAYILVDREGRVDYVNEVACSRLGYGASELLGRHVWEFVQELDVAEFKRMYELAKSGRVPPFDRTYVRKDGSTFPAEVSISYLEMDDGYLFASVRDMTEKREFEERLEVARGRAKEMARIRNSILTNMTHEVRTPLTVILGFTSVLRSGVDPAYERFTYLIERSSRRLLLMLDTILDLAQLEGGTLDAVGSPYNAGEAIEMAIDALRPLLHEKQVDLQIDLPREPIYLQMNNELFTHVINNLLDNAAKFTEEGEIRIALEHAGEGVRLVVEDTGVGIEPEFLPNVFDEFAQESTGLDRTYQGPGLGMAVTKRILDELGGTIDVSNREGGGTRFIVEFPAALCAFDMAEGEV